MTYTPEQDLNHNTISSDHRYSCHNKPFRPVVRYAMQKGWHKDGKRAMVEHVTEWLNIPCGHSFSSTDPSCVGCHRRERP